MGIKYTVLILFTATVFLLGWGNKTNEIPQYGMCEISFESYSNSLFQFPRVNFYLPDGSTVKVDGFYDGGNTYKARAYCKQAGLWKWEITKNPGFKKRTGKFTVVSSNFKGKLKKHPDDPYQFAYDNDNWFLHLGGTGYRYLTETEKLWQEYIDQAVKIGITKIRTWFCSSRHNVEALFDEELNMLNLPYWQEMDRRIAYALEQHPGYFTIDPLW